MAIINYTPREYTPETVANLKEYNDESIQINKSVFSALGSYWNQYYSNLDTINTLFSGMVSLLSQEYLNLLNLVLSSNILSIPIDSPYRIKLLVFSSNDRITNYAPGSTVPSSYDYNMSNLVSTTALVNSIFDPDVCLESGTHFEVIDNKIRFYVDIFNDVNITKDAYKVSNNGTDFILFLAVDLVLDEYSIYHKFGTFMYKKLPNSVNYKLIITALQLFYTGNTNVSLTETTLNILLGLPFCGRNNEEVLAIIPSLDITVPTKVYTTKSMYSVHQWAEVLVEVGDVLKVGTLIGRWTVVNDWISNPEWYYHSKFPYELFSRFNKAVYQRNLYSDQYSIIYNSRHRFNGAIHYRSADNILITDPEEALAYAKKWYRSLKTSREPFEVWLYEQFEGYLKYNTYSIKTVITHETFEKYNDVRTQFFNIEHGTPVYLYPIVDTVLVDRIEESVHYSELFKNTLRFKAFEDWVTYAVPNHPFLYNGEFLYDGSKTYNEFTNVRLLQLDDSAYSITLKINPVDVCTLTYYGSGYIIYNSDIAYDGSHNYSKLNGVNEDFSFIIISR